MSATAASDFARNQTVPLTHDTEFLDRLGQRWDLSLSLWDAKQLEGTDLSSVGFAEPLSLVEGEACGQFLLAVYNSLPLSQAVIFLICRLRTPDLTEEAFLAAMDGRSLFAAQHALWRSLELFFPRRETSLRVLRESAQAMRESEGAAVTLMADKLLAEFRSEADRLTREAEAELRGMTFTEPPLSSGATGTP